MIATAAAKRREATTSKKSKDGHSTAKPEDLFYTIPDIAQLLSLSKQTVRKWIENGILEAINVNPIRGGKKAWRVHKSTLEQWIDQLPDNSTARRKRNGKADVQPIHSTASQAAAKSPAKRRTLRPKRQYV